MEEYVGWFNRCLFQTGGDTLPADLEHLLPSIRGCHLDQPLKSI